MTNGGLQGKCYVSPAAKKRSSLARLDAGGGGGSRKKDWSFTRGKGLGSPGPAVLSNKQDTKGALREE